MQPTSSRSIGVKPSAVAPAPAHFDAKIPAADGLGHSQRRDGRRTGNDPVAERRLRQRARRVRAADRQISGRAAKPGAARRRSRRRARRVGLSRRRASRRPEAVDEAVFLEAASAKIRTAEAAAEGSAIAHQVFGAIGFTRSTCCTASRCACSPGVTISATKATGRPSSAGASAARGADEFWPLVASR